MLKQISVVGVMDGEEVNHLYSYINFRPYIAPDGAFDVCAIVPKGANCDCAGKKVRLLTLVDGAVSLALCFPARDATCEMRRAVPRSQGAVRLAAVSGGACRASGLLLLINPPPWRTQKERKQSRKTSPGSDSSVCSGLQAATKAQVDNEITFSEDGSSVQVTTVPAATVRANTASSDCPAADQFTGARKLTEMLLESAYLLRRLLERLAATVHRCAIVDSRLDVTIRPRMLDKKFQPGWATLSFLLGIRTDLKAAFPECVHQPRWHRDVLSGGGVA